MSVAAKGRPGCLFIGCSQREIASFGSDLVLSVSMPRVSEAKELLRTGCWQAVVIHLRALDRDDPAESCRTLVDATQAPVIVIMEARTILSSEEACRSKAAGFYCVEQLTDGLFARAMERVTRKLSTSPASAPC